MRNLHPPPSDNSVLSNLLPYLRVRVRDRRFAAESQSSVARFPRNNETKKSKAAVVLVCFFSVICDFFLPVNRQDDGRRVHYRGRVVDPEGVRH